MTDQLGLLFDDEESEEFGAAEPIDGQLDFFGGVVGGAGQLNLLDEIEATSDEETARERAHDWIGLPVFRQVQEPPRVVVSFEDEAARTRFLAEVGIRTIHKNTRGTLSVWWPERPREDLSSLRFVADREAA